MLGLLVPLKALYTCYKDPSKQKIDSDNRFYWRILNTCERRLLVIDVEGIKDAARSSREVDVWDTPERRQNARFATKQLLI